ncbi:hypothetical protein SD22575_2982 [Shigella dysenteriae 225-75]|nr:hypothetical protein SD22575_2982 [Shigella dysenteriae 225-75]
MAALPLRRKIIRIFKRIIQYGLSFFCKLSNPMQWLFCYYLMNNISAS